MQRGGGRDDAIDTAIRKVLGDSLDSQVKAQLSIIPANSLESGGAFSIAGSGDLSGSVICNVFIPEYKEDSEFAVKYLARAYQGCFGLADTAHLFRVAFPPGGIDKSAYPSETAASVAVDQLLSSLQNSFFVERCTLVVTPTVFDLFVKELLRKLQLAAPQE